MLAVTRRPNSVVEIRKALDPVKAHLEDVWALASTKELPGPVMRRVVPGYCRSALEAVFIGMVRRRILADGRSHTDVEESLAKSGTLNTLAALALFDDRDRGGDVMARLNSKIGGWAGDAFKNCKEGAHQEFTGDIQLLIRDTEKLAEKVQAL